MSKAVNKLGKEMGKAMQSFAYEKYGTGAEIKWIDEDHIKVKKQKHKVIAVTETSITAKIKYAVAAVILGYFLYLYCKSKFFLSALHVFKKSGLNVSVFFKVLFIPAMTFNLVLGYLFKAFNLDKEFIILTNKAIIVTRWDYVFKKTKAKAKPTDTDFIEEEESLQPVSITNSKPVLKKKKRKKALVVSYMTPLEDIDENSLRSMRIWFAPFIDAIAFRIKDNMFNNFIIEEVKDREEFLKLLIKAVKRRKKKLAEKLLEANSDSIEDNADDSNNSEVENESEN